MIETLYSAGNLATPTGFLVAFLVGLAFGTCLELAGFGSSRRLAGIFYFRDMTVLKVMFTAVVVAMLGLAWLNGLGWLSFDRLHLLDTIYGAQVVGGLLFGIGFVMGAWCPGTAAVGVASGRVDALVFLVGAMLGSLIYAEGYSRFQPLSQWGNQGVSFVYDLLGLSLRQFALVFTLVAVAAFWVSEKLEEWSGTGRLRDRAGFLWGFSVVLILAAGGLQVLPVTPAAVGAGLPGGTGPAAHAGETATFLEQIELGADHVDPEDLADRLMRGDPGLVLVDVRPPDEFATWHLPGARNIPLSEMPELLEPYRNKGSVVLYSNGMTHPAQARDALARLGFTNVSILTDGLEGFIERVLKPASLRPGPLTAEESARIKAWRNRFAEAPAVVRESDVSRGGPPAGAGFPLPPSVPGLADTDWLAGNLGKPGLRIIDLRPQPEYNSGHIPGAVSLNVESVRGIRDGIPSMLLPADLLARLFSLMGLLPTDVVVIAHGEKVHDATLVGLALERLGHPAWLILDGGHARWEVEQRPVDKSLPRYPESAYPVPEGPDPFTVEAGRVLQAVETRDASLIDARPADTFSGEKVEEARGGHIPNALNRPYTQDILKNEKLQLFQPVEFLREAYLRLVPDRDRTVIVNCRTGHQASQTRFILKYLLGYKNVLWYDGGWTEWAARPELPVAR